MNDLTHDGTRNRGPAFLVLFGFAASAICALVHPDGVVHADDLSHYLYSKWAWRWPAYLLDDWGRPGCTTLYFLPAAVGWNACRVLAAALTAGAAWLAYRIADGLRLRHAWVVIPLAYAQPLFFQLSQTTLTETPLAFYLTLAVYLAQRGRWSLSSAALSLGLVTRHEAVLFVPVWVVFAWMFRASPIREVSAGASPSPETAAPCRWRCLLWLAWAPLLVNLIAVLAGMTPAAMKLLEPHPSSQYGHGGWLTFFSRAMEAWGPGVTILAIIGLSGVWRSGPIGGMIVSCIAVWFGGHTVIRALGLYASGGYARFLVPLSPLIAIAALCGWARLFEADPRARRRAVLSAAAAMLLLWIAAERQIVLYQCGLDEAAELPQLHTAMRAVRACAAVLGAIGLAALTLRTRFGGGAVGLDRLMPATILILIGLAVAALCGPLRSPPELEIIRKTLAELDRRGLPGRPIISASVWIDYAAGCELSLHRPTVRERLSIAPLGALFAWEKQFAASEDHKLTLDLVQSSGAFVPVCISEPLPLREAPYLRIFEKTASWASTPIVTSGPAPRVATPSTGP